MKYLLDVNLLLAAIWQNHPRHAEAFNWLEGKSVLLCPLAELGFLRISTNQKAINAPMAQTRELLLHFCSERQAEWISDDLPALESCSLTSAQVTDIYLADLAQKHHAKLATLDQGIDHQAVEVLARDGG